MSVPAQTTPAPAPAHPRAHPIQAMLDGPEPLPMFHMVVVANYLDGLQDFINLEKTCKGYLGIGASFRYNPIDLDGSAASNAVFQNVETLHVYSAYAGPYHPLNAGYHNITYWRTHDYGNGSASESEDGNEFKLKGLVRDHNIPNSRFCVVRWDGRIGKDEWNISKEYSLFFTIKQKILLDPAKREQLHVVLRPLFGGFISQPINTTLIREMDLTDAPIAEIPANAFAGCLNLVSVRLPSGLKRVGSYAFDRSPIEELTINVGHPINFDHNAFFCEWSELRVLFIYDSEHPNRDFSTETVVDPNLQLVYDALDAIGRLQRRNWYRVTDNNNWSVVERQHYVRKPSLGN